MAPWLKTVGMVAPTVASCLGSPLAGLALQLIGSAFGISNPTEEQLQEIVVKAKPEDFVKLKEIESLLIVKLKELDVKLEEVNTQDRVSARTLMAGRSGRFIIVLASVILTGFFATVAYVLSGRLKGYDPEEIIVVGTVIGYAAAMAQQVCNYFFGSSSGSERKNDLVAAAMKNGGSSGASA